MRKPDFIIEIEKREEFVKKLTPITDWTKVKKNDLIFHSTTCSIHSPDKFVELTEEIGIEVVKYVNSEGKVHTMSRSGWFFFDENLEDEITELFTPKLYKHGANLTVACTVEEAFDKLKKNLNEDLSEQEFAKEVEILEEIDGYRIDLQ